MLVSVWFGSVRCFCWDNMQTPHREGSNQNSGALYLCVGLVYVYIHVYLNK